MTLARVRNPEALRYVRRPASGAPSSASTAAPRPRRYAASSSCWRATEHTVRRLAVGVGSHLGQRARRRLGDAGRGRPREGVRRGAAVGCRSMTSWRREKLCLPASVSYWINALGGTPLQCLHQALDPKQMMSRPLSSQEVVPQLVELGVPESTPDLTRPIRPARRRSPWCSTARRWSPDLFQWLARRGIAASPGTNFEAGEDWPDADVSHLRGSGPRACRHRHCTSVDLAEQPIVLRNGLTVRQIRRIRRRWRRRSPSAADHHPPADATCEQVAGAMFVALVTGRTDSSICASSSTRCSAEPWSGAAGPSICAGGEPGTPRPREDHRGGSAAAWQRPAYRLAEALAGGSPGPRVRPRLIQTLVAELDELKQQRAATPTDPRARRRLAGAGEAGRPAAWRAAVHGRGADDRLSRGDPHDGAGAPPHREKPNARRLARDC